MKNWLLMIQEEPDSREVMASLLLCVVMVSGLLSLGVVVWFVVKAWR